MAVVMSDDQVVEGYLAFLAGARGRRPRTLEAYEACLARLREFMAGKPLLQASALELEAFAGIWLHKRGVVAASRKPYVSAVRGFYAWAAKRGLASSDAAVDLQHPKIAKPLPEALSLANAERLMFAPDLGTFLGLRDAAMLSLLIGCGLRVSGLVNLNEGSVRPSEIAGKPRLVLKVTEKGDKSRVLPIPREAEMLLRVYLEHEELAGYDRDVKVDGRVDKVLFVNARNTRCSVENWRGEAVRMGRKSVWRMVQKHGKSVGVPEVELHPHAMRHLFGTELGEDKVDLIMRQQLLGHADPKSTAIYDQMAVRRTAATIDNSGPLAKIKSPASELLRRL